MIGSHIEVTAGLIYSLCGDHERGKSSLHPDFVVFAADTQDDGWKWVMCAFNKKGDCLVSNWGVSGDFDEMLRIAREGIEFLDMRFMADLVLVDEGSRRVFEARKEAKLYQPWVMPCKSVGGMLCVSDFKIARLNIDRGGFEKVNVVIFNGGLFSSVLYGQYISKSESREKLESGESYIFFPSELEEDFVSELCSEKLVPNRYGDLRWVTSGDCYYGDALKMCLLGHALKRRSRSTPELSRV
ncbi:MAG: hypothetical protein ACSHX0_06825 [Akkermansiaceae bacterium]